MQATRIAKARGADEALLVRPDGVVLEAPTSTIFWVSAEGELRTPALATGILDSITRARVVARARGRGGRVRARRPARGAARRSSPRPPARSSRSRRSTTARSRPGPRTAEAREAFARRLAEELGARAGPMIDFELSDEQRLIQETARDFVDNEVVPRARDSDRAERFDLELARRLGDMGYLGAPVAEEYGGRGLDYVGYGLIVEEVGRGDSAMRTVVSVQTSLVCGSIERWGTEEQKQRWLPRLCAGEAFGCFGLTEPDTGSDAANLRTRAEKIDGGWRITGQKMWISLGNVAEVALIFAQTDPDEEAQGPRLLPRPDRERRLRHPGDPRQARAARLRHRRDLARRGRGRRRRADGRGRRRVQGRDVGARLGPLLGRRRLRRDLRGLRRRPRSPTRRSASQFDVPIASFQLVQEMIADMIVRRDAARMLVRRAGDAQGRRQAVDGRDLGREALRDRVGGRVREPGDPGPRRLGLRRRLPGRALPARRAGDDPLRGHLADPEADHRPRRDRDQRDGAAAA